MPSSETDFPVEHKHGRCRTFKIPWLSRYKGLVYSCVLKGGMCLYCALFGKQQSAGVGVLVKRPYSGNSHKASDILGSHFGSAAGKGNAFRSDAVVAAMSFLRVMDGKQAPVNRQIDLALQERVKTNRAKLASIVKTVIFCGRQNIPLRGHRDDSKHLHVTGHNPGNCQALLQFRVEAGDDTLKQHFATAESRATYRSKTTQNEVISVCGEFIRNGILDEVRQACFYSISADEAVDRSNHEQMTLVVRFCDESDNVREEFMEFVACPGSQRGVAARIREKCPKAGYTHCCSHKLNLALVKAMGITAVGNMMDTADKLVRFYNFSPKRQHNLEKCIDDIQDGKTDKVKLKELCRTRWVARHDAFNVFIDLYESIVSSLQEIRNRNDGWNAQSANGAMSLYIAITQFPFIAALITTIYIMAYVQPISVSLQSKTFDIVKATDQIKNVIGALEDIREKVDTFHSKLYSNITSVGKTVGVLPA